MDRGVSRLRGIPVVKHDCETAGIRTCGAREAYDSAAKEANCSNLLVVPIERELRREDLNLDYSPVERELS